MNTLPDPSASIPSSMASMMPKSTPAPLHDIVGPLPFFPYTTQQVSIASLLVLLILAVMWWIIWKRGQTPPLTPREAVMKALLAMKEELMKGSDHDFGVRVSGLLRSYLNEVFSLAAPRQTTEEFLGSLRGNKKFTDTEQETLGNFLQQSDLLKFAGGKASQDDRLALVIAAEHFVQSEEKEEKDNPSKEDPLK